MTYAKNDFPTLYFKYLRRSSNSTYSTHMCEINLEKLVRTHHKIIYIFFTTKVLGQDKESDIGYKKKLCNILNVYFS